MAPVLGGVCDSLGIDAGRCGVESLVRALQQHFSDQSQRLTEALSRANERAWKTMEISLAGESLWSWLDSGENKALRQQVRMFLETTPLEGLPGHGPEFRQVWGVLLSK